VREKHHVRIEGNGAVLKAFSLGDRNRAQLVLQGGSDITVHNLVVRGANPAAGASRSAYQPELEAQHAFSVSGATDVVLDDVQAYDVYGDFVYIGSGPRGETSRNVTVSNSEFSRSGRQGISVTNGVNVTIKGNKIGEVARSLFDIEPNDPAQQARSIHIIGNTTGAAVNFWLADKGAPASIGDIEISGNRMTAATGGLFFVFVDSGAYRGPFLFENNDLIANNKVMDEGSKGAFFFTHAENITIRNNTVHFEGTMPAVELRELTSRASGGEHLQGRREHHPRDRRQQRLPRHLRVSSASPANCAIPGARGEKLLAVSTTPEHFAVTGA